MLIRNLSQVTPFKQYVNKIDKYNHINHYNYNLFKGHIILNFTQKVLAKRHMDQVAYCFQGKQALDLVIADPESNDGFNDQGIQEH